MIRALPFTSSTLAPSAGPRLLPSRCWRVRPQCRAGRRDWGAGCDTLPYLAGLAAAAWGGPAVAEEAQQAAAAAAAVEGPPADFGGAAAAAAQLADSDPTNIVISVLFTIAIGALSVVTLGVGYLSFTSWMDSRTEAEDRKRAGGLSPISSGTGAAAAGGPAKKPKKSPQEPVTSKGFGKKK